MRKHLWLAIFLLSSLPGIGQEVYRSSGNNRNYSKPTERKGFDASKLIFGGNFNMLFGNQTLIGVSPILGYRITKNFGMGIGMGYQYYSQKDAYGLGYPYQSNVFNPSIWARFNPFQFMFLSAEYDYFFGRESGYIPTGSGFSMTKVTQKFNYSALWLGGGFRQPVSSNVSFYLGFYYNILDKSNDPYAAINYDAGVIIGL